MGEEKIAPSLARIALPRSRRSLFLARVDRSSSLAKTALPRSHKPLARLRAESALEAAGRERL